MIFGVCSQTPIQFRKEYLERLLPLKTSFVAESDHAGFAFFPESFRTNQRFFSGLWQDEESENWFILQGNVFNYQELFPELPAGDKPGFQKNFARCFLNEGASFLARINGQFALAVYDGRKNKLFLARDHFGVEPLYFYQNNDNLIFSSDPLLLLDQKLIPNDLNYNGLYTYFLFNYIPTSETLVKNLWKLRPAHLFSWENGTAHIERYWYLSFKQEEEGEDYFTAQVLSSLRRAVSLRLEKDGSRPGAFLSGGMDSSSVVGLSAPELQMQLHTFSFRCKGESYDESYYARYMSDAYNTLHHQVEFPVEETAQIRHLVELMPEPFCDIGIEVASYLLARYAHQHVDYILSGDGGDELFAGHPVYVADNVARYFDALPGFLRIPITRIAQWLPDTEKKKSFAVKAKRFSYSCQFPKSLYSNRWRIYYTEKELAAALQDPTWAALQSLSPLKQIEAYYEEADGQDFLSKTLYGDYATVVKFYLTRMSILRHFGVEPRFPMFDYELVELAASIPSNLKIRGSDDTKYILKKTMTGVLPDTIVFRKDKLGHSVPMKNWMRDSQVLQQMIRDVLNPDQVQKRGFFRPQFVTKLIDDHMSRRMNNSHRIWSLLVLELWMQKHIDR